MRREGQQCDRQPVEAFTLHGLWPEFERGGWPQFCKADSSADVLALGVEAEPASPHMRCEWPSFHGGEAKFWDHEWSKHGTCAEPVIGNQSIYFQTALELHDIYDLNKLLLQHGGPLLDWSSVERHSSTAVAAVIQDAWGAAPRLACDQHSLSEIWMCFDLNLGVRECPSGVGPRTRCPEEFYLPQGMQVRLCDGTSALYSFLLDPPTQRPNECNAGFA